MSTSGEPIVIGFYLVMNGQSQTAVILFLINIVDDQILKFHHMIRIKQYIYSSVCSQTHSTSIIFFNLGMIVKISRHADIAFGISLSEETNLFCLSCTPFLCYGQRHSCVIDFSETTA